EDAVKQRLARGREMVREQVSEMMAAVLVRTAPTAVFTMSVAGAIHALTTPAAVAGGAFASAVGAPSSPSLTSAGPILSAMSTSKTAFVTAAAVITVVCIPVGYQVRSHFASNLDSGMPGPESRPAAGGNSPTAVTPAFTSALMAEWRQLHETHGTSPESMPRLYAAIEEIQDPFRRRGFRTALIAEWVQVDPAGGLKFFFQNGRDAAQRRQFFLEWLEADAPAAVE